MNMGNCVNITKCMQQKSHRVFLRKVNFDFSKYILHLLSLVSVEKCQVHSIPEFLPEVVTAAYYYMYTSA